MRCAVGGCLLASAALVAVRLATSPVAYPGLLGHRLFYAAAAIGQWVAGVWLMSGLLRRAGWPAAAGVLVALAGWSGAQAIAGLDFSGWLGDVPLAPWAAAGAQVALLAAVIVARPSPRRTARRPGRIRWAAWPAAAAAGVVAVLLIAPAPPAGPTDTPGLTVLEGNNIVVEPGRWPGHPLPLLDYLDQPEPLREGDWTILLYHHDCPHCRGLLARMAEQSRKLADRSLEARIAVLEVPPFAASGPPPEAQAAGWLSRRLRAGYTWFVPTPTVLQVRDGRVRAASVQPAEPGADEALDLASVPIARDAHDFGYVDPDTRHYLLFEVANPAPAARTIRSVQAECPCLSVLTPTPAELPAGGAARFLIRFHPAVNQIEQYAERIVAMTDAGEPVALQVRARIGLDLDLRPARLDLGALAVGGQRTCRLEIINDGRRPHVLQYSSATLAGVQGGKLDRRIEPGQTIPLDVLVQPMGAALGPRRGLIQVHTDSALQPTLSAEIACELVAGGGQGGAGAGEAADSADSRR